MPVKRLLFILLLGMGSGLAAASPLPPTPAPIEHILYARGFTLSRSFVNRWRSETPEVSRGVLVVISANPDLVYPRQGPAPVLYAGDQTAIPLNTGYPSGRVIAIVPGDPARDLSRTLIWFGSPGLSELADQRLIAQQRALAIARGIGARPRDEIERAREAGGGPFRSTVVNDMFGEVARLIRKHAQAEMDLSETLMRQQ